MGKENPRVSLVLPAVEGTRFARRGSTWRSPVVSSGRKNPPIRKKLWSGALWSPPSDFAGSCGGALIAGIRKSIEQQHRIAPFPCSHWRRYS
ncbi:MAG: hypothetical protein M1313_09990 [Nitrospirae bacterium]|nr:hypothetical protein [Nitrospirota bacterium]